MSGDKNDNQNIEYRSLDDALESVKKRLAEHPVAREQGNESSESELTVAISEDAIPVEEEISLEGQLVDQRDLFPRPSEGIVFNGRNLERMAHQIFPHSRAQGVKDDVREIQVGEGFIRIKAIPSTGHYTHKVQETLLACLKQWQHNANFEGEIWVTMSDLCRLKGLKPTGENIVLVKKHLNILYDTVQDWIRSYDVNGQPTDMMKFRFLSEFSYTDGTKRGDVSNFDKKVYLRFHSLLTADMVAGNINPVAMATLLSIKNEMAASWFKYTDTRITQNHVGRISGRSMIGKLMLSEKRYSRPSRRYELLNTLRDHCHGRTLSDGRTYQCFIEKTADGKDYMLVERAGEEIVRFKPRRQVPVVNHDDIQVQVLAQDILDVVGNTQNIQWYRFIARHCSQNTVYRALSEYKESVRVTTPISPGAYFTKILRVILESMGEKWIANDTDNPSSQKDLIQH